MTLTPLYLATFSGRGCLYISHTPVLREISLSLFPFFRVLWLDKSAGLLYNSFLATLCEFFAAF
jgi:hypothetical protein